MARRLLDEELNAANPFYRTPDQQRRDQIAQADQASARRMSALDGATVPQISMATPPPATSLAEFGDPNSRFRQVNEPGLTREERQRRRDRFTALDQASLGRAHELNLAGIDARGKVDVARETARGQMGAAQMQGGASIVQSILGGDRGGRRESGGMSPLDSIRIAESMGFQNPTQMAKDERAVRESARKSALDVLQKDFGQVYPGDGYAANQGPYTIDDYIKDITHARKTPVPRMEAILDDLNKQYQAAYGRPYFDRKPPGEGLGYGAPATQGMGDVKAADAQPAAPAAPAAAPQTVAPGRGADPDRVRQAQRPAPAAPATPGAPAPQAQSAPAAPAPQAPTNVHAQALNWAYQTLESLKQNPTAPNAAELKAKAEAIRRKAQQAGQI